MNHQGVISAGDPQTVAAGAEILRQGGNAIDAAVAAAFASFVSEMVLVNISGGGIATVHLAESGQNLAYDFFCDMPGGVFDEARSDFKHILIDFGAAQQSFYIGRASVAVPGVVAGLCALAENHGSLPLPALLAPAVRLAREGAIVSASHAYIADILTPIFTDTPESAQIYAPQGRAPRPGNRLRNPQLARTLERLGADGPDFYYRGELTAHIVADQTAHGGLLSADDLAAYRVRCSAPIRIDYRGYTALLPPPASVGGPLIAFSLKLLAGIELAALPLDGAGRVRAIAEALRLTNIARTNLRLTPDGVSAFLDEAHMGPYRRMLADVLAGHTPPPEPTFAYGSSDTTHISVIDGAGNIVSVTTSAGEGAGFMVADTGVAMNNILGEVDLHPEGFHQTPPGRRLQTMMSPALVLKDNKPVLVVGSGGSTRLRSAIVQVLSNVLDYHLPLQAAVEWPRLHFEEGTLQLEGGVPAGVQSELAQAGYQLNVWPGTNMYFGGVHSVGILDGHRQAVGDARRGGAALVVD